jgi:hypothetical protein
MKIRIQTTVSVYSEIEVPDEASAEHVFNHKIPESHYCPDGWHWESCTMWYGDGEQAGEVWEEFNA